MAVIGITLGTLGTAAVLGSWMVTGMARHLRRVERETVGYY